MRLRAFRSLALTALLCVMAGWGRAEESPNKATDEAALLKNAEAFVDAFHKADAKSRTCSSILIMPLPEPMRTWGSLRLAPRLDTISGAEHKRQLRDAGVILDTPLDGRIDWNKSIDRIVDAVKSEAAHGVALVIGEKGLQGRLRATREGRPNQVTPNGMSKAVTAPTGEQLVIARTQRLGLCPQQGAGSGLAG